MAIPQKFNIELPYDPAVPLLGIYLKELNRNLNGYLYTNVHSNSEKVKATKMFMVR